MQNTYWNNYYSKHNSPFKPSSFAKFILKYIDKEKTIVDIGCGNGRDSLYFASKNLETLGVDSSSVAISNLEKNSTENLSFKVLNVKDINKELGNTSIDICYYRFVLHSFNKKIEKELFQWLRISSVKLLCIETRVEEDVYDHLKQDHYRRPINEVELKQSISDSGFKIIYDKTSNKFSKYKSQYGVNDLNNDPLLLRIIAKKI